MSHRAPASAFWLYACARVLCPVFYFYHFYCRCFNNKCVHCSHWSYIANSIHDKSCSCYVAMFTLRMIIVLFLVQFYFFFLQTYTIDQSWPPGRKVIPKLNYWTNSNEESLQSRPDIPLFCAAITECKLFLVIQKFIAHHSPIRWGCVYPKILWWEQNNIAFIQHESGSFTVWFVRQH